MWNGRVDHPAARSRVIVPHHLPCTINPVNQGIVTVNPHNLMTVGNRECKGVSDEAHSGARQPCRVQQCPSQRRLRCARFADLHCLKPHYHISPRK